MHRLANALVEAGHNLTCYTFSPRPDDAVYEHVQLHYRTHFTVLRKFIPAVAFARLNLDSYDIIHFHGDDYLAQGRANRFRTFYGSALFEALHAHRWKKLVYQALFYLLEWASLLHGGHRIGISKATRRALPFIHTVIPCGVPTPAYTPGLRKTEQPSILFIGDLHSRKRGIDVIAAFEALRQRKMSDCTLTIIGPETVSGKNITSLQWISKQEIIDEYRQAWVYCMASSYEGFGVPVLEAMACGTAVVAVRNAGVGEIITHKYNGLLCSQPQLYTSLYQALNNEALRKRLVANGLSTAAKFTSARMAAQYERIYRLHTGKWQ
ncbi:MAG: glycosyltransferase [Chitinivibrionales bacterium]|nr:glycosyltransferase [Chitinivibrionales bacterium]